MRLFHTVRHLRPAQVAGRLWFRIWRPRPDLRPPPPLRPLDPWTDAPARAPSLVDVDTMCLLNETRAIDWNDASAPKLWLYNLHYFDDLNATDAHERAAWHRALIRRWVDENPPGHGVGWDPYPTSLRIVNWAKSVTRGAHADPAMLHSLAVQARWLQRRLEYHLGGNHLLVNAKALVFAGLLFDGPEASAWYRRGTALVERELNEQILSDGGHYELSPMYHLTVLEDLLDLLNLHRTAGHDAPRNFQTAASAMLCWSAVMRHPDGEIPFFNDAAFGIAPSPASLDRYADALGVPRAPVDSPLHWLQASGYVRAEAGPATLFTDIAAVGPDHLPAHAHADTLSFELSLQGRRAIVNGGTSEYGTGAERQRQRGTEVHATALVDGQNSSDVWHGFRVGRRARVVDADARRDADAIVVQGAHDGYRHLHGRPIHRRQWILHADRLQLVDTIEGAGVHGVDIVLPLAPGLQPVVRTSQAVDVIDADDGRTVLRVTHGSDTAASLETSTWHPRFGISEPSCTLRLRLHGEAPLRHETVLAW